MVKKKECERCKGSVDIEKDFFVTLGTHEGIKEIDMRYFHFNCWKLHFEERARQKAEAVAKGIEQKMLPIAKGLTQRLKKAIEEKEKEHGVTL